MQDTVTFDNHRMSIACVWLERALDKYRRFGVIEIIHNNGRQVTFKFKDHYGYIAARTHERNRLCKTR